MGPLLQATRTVPIVFKLPEAIKQWSLTSLREKLVKIGAKVVRHDSTTVRAAMCSRATDGRSASKCRGKWPDQTRRYVIFQMAEVAVPKELFHEILRLIAELRPQSPPAPA